MHKSYKRKNTRNKTRKKYYKVGGGDDDPIIEPIVTSEISDVNTKITNLENSINTILDEIPVCIGYKLFGVNQYPIKIPLFVKRNIDSETFLEIIGNAGTRNRNSSSYEWIHEIKKIQVVESLRELLNLIDLKAVYSLPNVRGLPLEQCSKNMVCDDAEDRQIFEVLKNKQNIQKLQVKYHNLFERPDPKFFEYNPFAHR